MAYKSIRNSLFRKQIHKTYKQKSQIYYIKMALNWYLVNFFESLDEILIILVSLIISYYSRKIYKLVEDKNYKLFSISFLIIAIAFVFKLFSDLTILHRVEIENANFVFVVFSQFKYMQLINFISFNLFKIFYLIGFLILFLIVNKEKERGEVILFFYFSLIAVILSIYFNFIFHLTLLFIISFLTIYFYKNHKKVKTMNSLLVFLSFIMFLISHLFFVFSDTYSALNLIGSVLLLIGFLNLLINQVKLVRKNEPKTNKTRSNKRYLRNTAKK
jgi:hypothetical protein